MFLFQTYTSEIVRMKGIFTVQQVLHFQLSSSETELGAEVAGVLDRATGSYYGQLNGWLVGVSFFAMV